MPQHACEECGEMVDEGKAFCPSCGHAFVEEQRREKPSEFQSMDGTQQFGKTMYNQMLSDMGLNLKAVPKPRTQVIQAAVPAAVTPAPVKEVPAAPPPAVAEEKRSNKFLIFGIIAAFLILGFLLIVALGLFLWWRFG